MTLKARKPRTRPFYFRLSNLWTNTNYGRKKIKNEESKVLLTQGEEGKLKAITGEQDDKLKTVDPKKENADQFMKIDTNGNALENFFKTFSAKFQIHTSQIHISGTGTQGSM